MAFRIQVKRLETSSFVSMREANMHETMTAPESLRMEVNTPSEAQSPFCLTEGKQFSKRKLLQVSETA